MRKLTHLYHPIVWYWETECSIIYFIFNQW